MQNYTDHEVGISESDVTQDARNTNLGTRKTNGGWTPIQRGTIFDDGDSFDVTFREGLGNNDGQTLISDGHISRKNLINTITTMVIMIKVVSQMSLIE